MKGTILYQIKISGNRKSLDGVGKFNSKKVYIEKPTKEQVDEFIEKCTNSTHPHSLYDLENDDNLKIEILELIVG